MKHKLEKKMTYLKSYIGRHQEIDHTGSPVT